MLRIAGHVHFHLTEDAVFQTFRENHTFIMV